MAEFSGDEAFVLLASLVASLVGAIKYYGTLIRVTTLAGGREIRNGLAVIPPLCLLALAPVLFTLTSHEVKEDHAYIVLFLAAGNIWLALALNLSAIMGVSFRDDAVERNNRVAAIAISGAMIGSTCIYAGANIGEGATIWMTFGPAILATAAWAIAWLILEFISGISDAIAIERDLSSARRLAVFLITTGALLGWAVAGDYQSADATLTDLATRGWPVLPLAILFALFQKYQGPRIKEQA